MDFSGISLSNHPELMRALGLACLRCLSEGSGVYSRFPQGVKGNEKKRKQHVSSLPDGSGWGDHIQLLQVYDNWVQEGYNPNWCKDNDIQSAPVDVDSNPKQRGMEQHYRNLRKALCKGYGNQLAERMLHHNGYRTIGFRSQLVQVHQSSVLQTDEDGRLSDYVVYHELIATPHPFMRNVCSVEMSWVMPILKKLEKLNVDKLSGSFATSEEQGRGDLSMDLSKQHMSTDKDVDKIRAARDRYLARKAKKT
ncbi:hypothetical protein Taro_021123 [Colocasia esculenta]|uniref:DEAD-box helicase OB fold domain-containing protein n=1 Tax=Colocasia esculenta TaxID=4460 RepID=A0A843V7A0_COLES|nr:hypothetical protein [Colocasia esculenta]